MKTYQLTTNSLDKCIQSLREKIKPHRETPEYLLVPATVRGEIDRTKYKGKGRPRYDDYERIDFLKTVNELTSSTESNSK